MLDRTTRTHTQRLNHDLTHYAILCVHNGTAFFAERELAESCSRQATVNAIAGGHYEHVAKVFAFHPIEHTADDVTSDIAVDIAQGLDPGEPVSRELFDFIEANAGSDYARGVRVYDSTFAAA